MQPLQPSGPRQKLTVYLHIHPLPDTYFRTFLLSWSFTSTRDVDSLFTPKFCQILAQFWADISLFYLTPADPLYNDWQEGEKRRRKMRGLVCRLTASFASAKLLCLNITTSLSLSTIPHIVHESGHPIRTHLEHGIGPWGMNPGRSTEVPVLRCMMRL